MKRGILTISFVFVFVFFHCVVFGADKSSVLTDINNAKNAIEKLLSQGAATGAFAEDIRKAQEHLKTAETEFNKNTTILGNVKDEAVPTIKHHAMMSQLTVSVIESRLKKISLTGENSQLEKKIPDIETKIKVIEAKDAEIARLREKLAKPESDIQALSSDISRLKADNTNLAKEMSLLKTDNATLSGRIDTLNSMIASLKKDLADKIKMHADVSAENNKLKEEAQKTEAHKGSELKESQAKLRLLTRIRELLAEIGQLDELVKISGKSVSLLLPRNYFIKTTSRGMELSAESDKYINRVAALMRKFPEYKTGIKVFGFGQPSKNEDRKATEHMARMIKDALLEKGLGLNVLEVSGAGQDTVIFSKKVADENRRVEVTFYFGTL